LYEVHFSKGEEGEIGFWFKSRVECVVLFPSFANNRVVPTLIFRS